MESQFVPTLNRAFAAASRQGAAIWASNPNVLQGILPAEPTSFLLKGAE